MYKTNSGATVLGEHDGKTVAQLETCFAHDAAISAALCADGHLGYTQPIGAAIAYENYISPIGVGFDQGCGNLAVKTDLVYSDIKNRLNIIADDIERNISFGVGRKNNTKVDHWLFEMADAWKKADAEDLKDKAREQLGTVGSGNHYVDIMVETTFLDNPEFGGTIEDCPVWIGVHFGSRGLGHTLATKYMKIAGQKNGADSPPALLSMDSEAGERYWAAMTLSCQYANAGREWVVKTVREMLGGKELDFIHNNHNDAKQEVHNGKSLYVVRKGCTPAFPGQRGFVGGSMGDDAVIVEGVDSQLSRNLLYSTIHGAGRIMGRNQAKKTFTKDQMNDWLRNRGVILRGGDLDESPMAYRRLSEVLKHHEETIKVNNVLCPIIVAMAGTGDYDPWKD